MKVVITGGLGFLGQRLADRLLARESLAGPDGEQHAIDKLILFDVPQAEMSDHSDDRVKVVHGDVSYPADVAAIIDRDDVGVFHLASVLSAGAEADFDLALRVNMDGGRAVLDACRARGSIPRLVFTSTIATFGGRDEYASVSDTTKQVPETTYGTTKAMMELLVNDYTRKGYLDGRTARVATVIVRPGSSNPAASAFASAIFREPLERRDFAAPVSLETHMAVIGYRTVIDGLVQLYEVDAAELGANRAFGLPALTVSVGEMIESLRRVADDRPLGSISVEPDPETQRIVDSWPIELDSARAQALGLPADDSVDDMVRAYIEDFVS